MNKDLRNYFVFLGAIAFFGMLISIFSPNKKEQKHKEDMLKLDLIERKLELNRKLKYQKDYIETMQNIDTIEKLLKEVK